MKKLLFVAIAFTGLALVSCNKDQAAVKKLDGNWNVTAMTSETGGVTVDLLDGFIESASMTFVECKLKKDEWCTGSATTKVTGFPETTDNNVYRVTGDGTTLETKEHADSTDVTSITIDELSKTDGKFTQVDVNGSTTTTTKITVVKQ